MYKFIPFLILFIAFATVVPVGHAQGNSECEVRGSFIEAIDENSSAIFRINFQLNSGGGPLNDIDTARVSYRQLMSMREYHQQQRDVLPDCAQAINTAIIDTIDTAQDVFALLFMQGLDTLENYFLYDDDIELAVANLRQNFGALSDATSAIALVAPAS